MCLHFYKRVVVWEDVRLDLRLDHWTFDILIHQLLITIHVKGLPMLSMEGSFIKGCHADGYAPYLNKLQTQTDPKAALTLTQRCLK